MASSFFLAPTVDFKETTLNGAITDDATTITLASTANIQAPGYIVIDRKDASGTLTPSAREVVFFTGVSGNDLTGCTRGANNSTQRAHSSGAVVETTMTAGAWNSLSTIVASAVDGSGYLRAINSPVSISVGHFSSKFFAANATITNSLNASGASIVGLFPSGASGGVLTSLGNTVVPVFATPATDGWTSTSDTWTFATASTFTIAGVDRTSIFTKGTRLKFTQTTVKYAVVVSSSFSTNTTVTILVNTDYTIANAAITSPSYSYQANPQGYPGWFTCAAPTYDVTTVDNASGGQPTTSLYKLGIIGNTVSGRIQGSGTKATTNQYIRFAVPVSFLNATNYHTFGVAVTDVSATIGVCSTMDNTSYIWLVYAANIADNATIAGFGASFSYEF